MYAILCDYASTKNRCWPSHATLALDLSCSVSSVKNYLGELVRARLIVVRREQYRSCVYYLLRPEDLRDKKPQSSLRQFPPQQQPDCVQPKADHAQPKVGDLNTLKKQREEKNPPLPPTEAEPPKVSPVPKAPAAGGVSSSLASDFAIAFALYPKKEARAYAWIAWRKLSRSGQLPPLDAILTAIRRFTASESWQRDNGRYVPQMSHWIRGQRWRDPLSPAEETERRERQRREELNRAIQAHEEKEKRLQEQRDKEKARLRPLFNAFAAKFPEPLNDAMAAMVSGTWMHLHSRGIAPLASDVPAGNALGIVDFMNAFKRKRKEAAFRANQRNSQAKRFDANASAPMSCGELLRHSPVFSRLLSENPALQAAV